MYRARASAWRRARGEGVEVEVEERKWEKTRKEGIKTRCKEDKEEEEVDIRKGRMTLGKITDWERKTRGEGEEKVKEEREEIL